MPEIAGRACLVGRDADGNLVAKFSRRRGEPAHPDRGATTPHPTKPGYVIDWIWLLKAGPILFFCLLCLFAAWTAGVIG